MAISLHSHKCFNFNPLTPAMMYEKATGYLKALKRLDNVIDIHFGVHI